MEPVGSRSPSELPPATGYLEVLVSGLWRGNQLGRLMARSGYVKNQGEVHQGRKQKQRERETGTNLVKMPIDKAVIAIT